MLAQRFSGLLNNKVTKEFAELHAQNKFNKERFDGEAQGTIDGFVDAFKKNGLDEYIPEFLQKVTNKKSFIHCGNMCQYIKRHIIRLLPLYIDLK